MDGLVFLFRSLSRRQWKGGNASLPRPYWLGGRSLRLEPCSAHRHNSLVWGKKRSFDGAIARTEQAIAEGRGAIQDLRSQPVAQSDIAELLTGMGQELAAFEGANPDGPVFRVIVEGERRRLSPILHEEVYWIARELLRNALRHASAHRIEAEIRYEDHLFRLRIRDDGKGMDPKVLAAGGSAGHWGLPGVRERAQQLGVRLDFWSEAGAGTEVQLTVPAALAYEKSRDGAGFRLFRKSRIHEHQP